MFENFVNEQNDKFIHPIESHRSVLIRSPKTSAKTSLFVPPLISFRELEKIEDHCVVSLQTNLQATSCVKFSISIQP